MTSGAEDSQRGQVYLLAVRVFNAPRVCGRACSGRPQRWRGERQRSSDRATLGFPCSFFLCGVSASALRRADARTSARVCSAARKN